MFRRSLVLSALCACAPEPVPDVPPVAPPPSGREVEIAVVALDGRPVTSATLRGRFTVVVLGTTFDAASQAQARFLKTIAQRHEPRVNALMLMLETSDNRVILEAFVAGLDLPYPVAFADEATTAGRGAFPGLHHVPSVVVLDREGRERWRHVGLVEAPEIDTKLRELEGGR